MENLKPERRGDLLEAKITLRSLEPWAVLWGLPGSQPFPGFPRLRHGAGPCGFL